MSRDRLGTKNFFGGNKSAWYPKEMQQNMCCLELDNEKSHNLTARIMHALMPSLSLPWYIPDF